DALRPTDSLVEQGRRDVVEGRRARQEVVGLEDEADGPAPQGRQAVVVEVGHRRAGRSRHPRMFIIVLLPDPDGPTIATNSPGWMARLTSSSAGTSRRPME